MKPNEYINFFAYRMGRLTELFPEVQIRQAAQAVEHEIHILLRARPSLLGIGFRLISDTQKTASRTFRRWETVRAIAEEATSALCTALTAAD